MNKYKIGQNLRPSDNPNLIVKILNFRPYRDSHEYCLGKDWWFLESTLDIFYEIIRVDCNKLWKEIND